MEKLSNAATAFLARVKRLGRAFVPYLEYFHLELIRSGDVGYVSHSKGYWLYDKNSQILPIEPSSD